MANDYNDAGFENSERNNFLEVTSSNITPFELTYKHYNHLWSTTQTELANIIKTDAPHIPPPIYEDRLTAIRRTSKLYLQYIRVCNKFIECHNNISHPQKRRFLRKISDACIGRILELKHELVELEKADFHYLYQMLLNLKMSPADMDVRISEYFKGDTLVQSESKIIVRKHLDTRLDEKMMLQGVSEQEKRVRMGMVFIRMIQAHERARQARELFGDIQKKSAVSEMKNKKDKRKGMQFNASKSDYAIIIQRAFRRYQFHKRLNFQCSVERRKLKMEPSCHTCELSNEIRKDRFSVIERNEAEYLRSKENLKQEMYIYRVPRMMDILEDKIRKYFSQYKDLYGDFPPFPTEKEGGSNALFFCSIKTEEKESKPDEKEGKDKKSKDEKSSSGKKGKEEKSESLVYSIKKSKYTPNIVELLYEFQKIWERRELSNFDRFDAKLLEEEVVAEIQQSVRLIVDEKMNAELTRLSESLKKDSKKKLKKAKKGGKDAKGMKVKSKKEVDLTPDRTLDSLVEELVSHGIIVDYPKVSIGDFFGEYNFCGSLKQLSGDPEFDPLPCLADIRRVVCEYCILPMGSQTNHSNGTYVKSLLLAGPQGSGKKTLVYAICNEIGATMMNLSSENIQGKYPGPEGLKMLSHLISKVSCLVQPTVIFIKDAESYFWKKKPNGVKLTEPGRLKNEIQKLIKRITDEDRILVCGTTDLPFDSDQKGLCGCYEKIICIFKPDYDCRVRLWKEIIAKYKGSISKDLDLTVLSNISDGFTAGSIESAVIKTLTDRRLVWQKKIPLCATDFVSSLAECVPVYDEEQQEYKSWLQKMPMSKDRISLLEQENEMKEEAEEEVPSDPDDY